MQKEKSTCGTILTEFLLNTGRRPQTSERAIKSPHNQGGQKKKEGEKDGNGTCAPGREPSKRQGSGTCEAPSPAGGGHWDREGASRAERRTCRSRRTARDLHRWSAPLRLPGPRHTPTGASRGCGLELGLQRANLGTGPGLAVQKQPGGAASWCDCSQQGMQRKPEPTTVVMCHC